MSCDAFTCLTATILANLLLTPFRTQNVPPPMSSYQLPLIIDNSDGKPDKLQHLRTPIHVSFSSSRDSIAVLHHQGLVQLWDLHTRLEFGRGKVIDPSRISEVSLTDTLTKGSRARQVLLTARKGESDTMTVSVLASDSEGDYIVYFTVTDSIPSPPKIARLASASGRLLHGSYRTFWQSGSGEIFEGATI